MSQSPQHGIDVAETASYLNELADLVEETGLTPADVGRVLTDIFSQSPVEQSGEVRGQVGDMLQSDVSSATFAAGLRWQAKQLLDSVISPSAGVN